MFSTDCQNALSSAFMCIVPEYCKYVQLDGNATCTYAHRNNYAQFLPRPHPKDDGRLCFHKSLPVNGKGGTSSSWLSILPDGGGYPILPDGGSLPSWWVPHPSWEGWVPHPSWWAYLILPKERGYPVQDWIPSELDGGMPFPCQDRMGVPHLGNGWHMDRLYCGAVRLLQFPAGGLSA